MAAARSYLSACLCFKEAAPYLAEWLAFYRVLGVEHFYLYNNNSTDDFSGVIAPYVKRGAATLIDFPGRGVQQKIYADCLKQFGPRTRWMMFCDDDEFLFPVDDRVSLPEVLEGFESYAGVAVSWLLYGSSGHETRPPGLVIENYRLRHGAADPHVKCVVDPARVVEPILIGHQFRCVGNEVIVNEYGVPMRDAFNKRPSTDILRINHYLTKSREELVQRRSRIQANTGKVSEISVGEWLRNELSWNQVDDPVAAHYAPRVRDTMRDWA